MAYFLLVEPSNEDSLYTPLWFKLGSDNANLTSFRYLVDIYINAVQVVRMKVLPDALYAGFADVSKVVRSYVVNYFAPVGTNYPLAFQTQDLAVSYDIEFGEEYESGGSITEYTNLDSGTYKALNAYNVDTPTSGYPFKPLLNMEDNWLTSRDLTNVQISRTGHAFISFWNDTLITHDYAISVQEIDANGANVGTAQLSTDILGTNRLLVFDLSITSINTRLTTPISTTAAGYKLQLKNATSGLPQSEVLTVWFLCEGRNPATTLHFMNRFGGFDTFAFTGRTRKELDMERKAFQRQPFHDGSTYVSEAVGGTRFLEGTINYHSKQTHTRKLNSGYLNDTDHNWLMELIASPQIYFEDNGYYFPVTIEDKAWRQKLQHADKMYNLELTIKIGRQVMSQSR